MQITRRDLKGRPRRVGELNGNPVWELETIGGLHVVADHRGKPLGVGSHRGIARHVARKDEPAIEWTDLQKADYVPVEFFQDLLPRYEALTRRAQEMWRP